MTDTQATTPKEKTRTLFAIADDMLAFFDLLDEAENDQDANAILETWFDENLARLNQKADGYAAVIREFEYRATARETEAKRLAEMAKTMNNRVKDMKYRFKAALEWMGMDRLETDNNSFRICANGGKLPLDIHDPKLIPLDYTYEVVQIDREKIRQAIEAGKDVPGAILQDRGSHLRIR